MGVSINSDLDKLQRDWGLSSAGSHDVGLAGGRILHNETFRMCSIAAMAKTIWGAEMGKSRAVRLRCVCRRACVRAWRGCWVWTAY